MTTEEKALALVNEVARELGWDETKEIFAAGYTRNEVLCRAIEQHEAFRQEVSDECIVLGFKPAPIGIGRFIIPAPKPDPLAQILGAFDGTLWEPEDVSRFRAALEAGGLEIREKNDG